VSQCQTYAPNSFIAARAHHNSFVAVPHATVALKQAKKFHVFH
jgi:hypothetical protein